MVEQRKVVWKFELKPQLEFPLELPQDFEVLHVGSQSNKPMMWALVDPKSPKIRRRFRSVLTGENFDHLRATYIGTFVLFKGAFVGHVFDLGAW